jgi:hypothetical protein
MTGQPFLIKNRETVAEQDALAIDQVIVDR